MYCIPNDQVNVIDFMANEMLESLRDYTQMPSKSRLYFT